MMSEWKEVISGDVLDLVSGYAFKSKDFKEFPDQNDLPVIKIKNVANGDVNFDKVVYHEVTEKLEKYILEKGDVLIAMTGNHPHAMTQVVGDVSRYKLYEKALLNQRVGKLVAKDDNCLDFFYYYFKDEDNRNYLANQSSGSANQANISKGDILGLPMLAPEPEEQRAIASILSSLDDKIDLLHRQNQTLEQMAEALFRQWFVERRPELAEGEADDGWEEGVLGDEFDFTMGQSPPGSSFNEEGLGVPMYQGSRDFGFRFPENRVFTTEPKRFAEKFDTLISVRAPVGEQNMSNEKCCIGRGVAAFRFKANPAYYTYTFFKMKSLMDEIKQFNEAGTVFGSISKNDFQEIEVTIPPIDIVEWFQNEVKPIDDRTTTNCIQIRTLAALRDTLLPKLMSGEVSVETEKH